MSRETIVSTIFDLLKKQKSVKFGRVQRDPIVPEELAKTAFPAAYIETTDEDIEDISMVTNIRQGVMLCNVVFFVAGENRDKQRNLTVEAVEATLMSDRTLDGVVEDCNLSRVETITVGEGAPYASYRIVFTIQHCYTL